MTTAKSDLPAKHAGGRPLKYQTVEDLQLAIDRYFESCEGQPLLDAEGNPVLNKFDEPIMFGAKPITMTGLAIALGFTSRQALLNYDEREEFFGSVSQARMRCQQYAETRLFDKDGANGAKFSLQNNFGWREQQDINLTATTAQQAGEYQTLRQLKEERERQSNHEEIVDIEPIRESDE